MAKTFDIGRVIATKAVSDLICNNEEFKIFVEGCFSKYILYDWGDTLPEHWEENNQAALNGGEVIAFYYIPEEIEEVFEDQLWIKTEADRSETLLLFVSDY